MIDSEKLKLYQETLEKIARAYSPSKYPGFEDRDDLFGWNSDDAYDKGVEAGEYHMGQLAQQVLNRAKE